MKYLTLIEEFIRTFPKFSDIAERKRKWWEGDPEDQPLVHVFFGDIVAHYLVEELTAPKSEGLLRRLFEFLESMAISDDDQVREVLTDSILEYLGDDKKILRKARALMGSKTLKLSHEVEKSWGRE